MPGKSLRNGKAAQFILAGVFLLIALVLGYRSISDRFVPPKDGGEVVRREKSSQEVNNVAEEVNVAPQTTPISRPPLAKSPAVDHDAVETRRVHDNWKTLDNSADDGWDTETFSDAALKQLKRLGGFLERPDELATADLKSIVTEKFTCGELYPDSLATIYEDSSLEIERLLPSVPALDASVQHNAAQHDAAQHDAAQHDAAQHDAAQHDAAPGLRTALQALADTFRDASDVRTEFKIFRVEPRKAEIETRMYVAVSGRFEDGVLEQHATWTASWQGPNGLPPRLSRLEVAEFEQTRSRVSTEKMFRDCTRSILEHNESYGQQFMRGFTHWLSRKQGVRYFAAFGNPGLGLGDVNGDGLDDLYVCQEQGLPNRLFLQMPDGTADDVSEAWEVNWLEDSRSALFVDLDNDGDQDLVVAFLGGIAIASNEPGKKFRLRSVLATSDDVMSLAAADYDVDGDIDIYVTVYYPDKFVEHSYAASLPTAVESAVYHSDNLGGRNVLLRNDIQGDTWNFADATAMLGLDQNNTRFSFSAAWEDFDNDGDLDLYVANDFGRDNLYQNEGSAEPKFVDIGDDARVEDAASGMGIAWADYDRDGWMDAYVCNMWSSAGNRITFQPQFKADADPSIKQRIQRFARGNTLLRNDGKQGFQHVSAEVGVEVGRWAWGAQFADINNDGWQDILIANGMITGEGPGDL